MAKVGAYWRSSPLNAGRAIHARVYELTRKKAQQLFEMVVDLSPVDSGAYRASWHISEGKPVYRWVGRQPRNAPELEMPIMPQLSTKFYRKFYVTNGAPYAYRLEYGWSEQAPLGVMRNALRMLNYV